MVEKESQLLLLMPLSIHKRLLVSYLYLSISGNGAPAAVSLRPIWVGISTHFFFFVGRYRANVWQLFVLCVCVCLNKKNKSKETNKKRGREKQVIETRFGTAGTSFCLFVDCCHLFESFLVLVIE